MHIDGVEHLPVRSDVVRTAPMSALGAQEVISSRTRPLAGTGGPRSDLWCWRRGVGPMGEENRPVFRDIGHDFMVLCGTVEAYSLTLLPLTSTLPGTTDSWAPSSQAPPA